MSNDVTSDTAPERRSKAPSAIEIRVDLYPVTAEPGDGIDKDVSHMLQVSLCVPSGSGVLLELPIYGEMSAERRGALSNMAHSLVGAALDMNRLHH